MKEPRLSSRRSTSNIQSNAVAVEFLGGLARRQGRWEDSRRFYAQAIELDPQNVFLLTDASLTDLDTRDAVAAQKHLGRARDLSPQNSTVIGFLAISFQLTGDIAQAQTLLDTIQPKRGDGLYVGIVATNAILLRKYDSAIAALKEQLQGPKALGISLGNFENILGDLERHAGHAAEAAAAYETTKQTVNELLRTQPDNPELLNELAWAETWLGDKAGAIAHVQRAITILPTSKDAVVGPSYEDTLARIEAHFGDKENAINGLQHLLSISYSGNPAVTPALLRLDPDWDNLRGDPRFEKLPARSTGEMNEFFQRLKQRKLVQWAIAYVAAAFALLQGMDIIGQQFGWPEGVRRGITLALVVGLFVTLVLAWYHGELGVQRVTGTELLIIGLVLAVGGGLLWRFSSTHAPDNKTSVVSNESGVSEPTRVIPEKSIAVLPFENLSSDKENAYFADGVQDEILSDLAKIADLKVISRTSVMQYKTGVTRNLREIGQQLGVAHLLEGSVQRAGNKVRVNAQLIDARTDGHLWAQVFDRPLDDVFAIQSEIAQAIADQLQAKLSPKETAAMQEKPTTNMAAYDLYLRAKEIRQSNASNGVETIQRQVALLEEAVTRDPAFVAAFCLLAQLHVDFYWFNYDHSAARLELAKKALDAAARLSPEGGEVHLTRAIFFYRGQRDYAAALKELALAHHSLPNDSSIPWLTGLIERRQGHFTESNTYVEQALAIDPHNNLIIIELCNGYTWAGRPLRGRQTLTG